MRKTLDSYRGIVGDAAIDGLYNSASPLVQKHVVHINSTHYGGGVAEILSSLTVLMNDIGMRAGWRVLKGAPEFFTTTKKFHNALQGEELHFTRMKDKVFREFNEANSYITHIANHDCVIVHDLQPLPFINYYEKHQPWIWRCHVDISSPNPQIWSYLGRFISKYDLMVVSDRKFQKKLGIPMKIIAPSIDPLSPKNEECSETKMYRFLSRHGIDCNKPIVAQVSRFDKWKDPLGVIRAFELVRRKFDCKLVLLGNTASDDPEGPELYAKVHEAANGNPDIIVHSEYNDFLVNTLQRAADVVVQKSLREGFALTVSEALWKGTPVVGGNAGGIPLQVKDGRTGYLVSNTTQCAKRVEKLLRNPRLAERLGKQGREHVRNNFLITRHLGDYIDMLKDKKLGLVK